MNDMKHTITTRLAALLLFVAGMAGCSEEDTLPGGNTTTPDSGRCPMTVSMSDGGYTSSDPSAPGTRAVEDGYATTFTAGDRIGLYAVKNGAIVASNICLTATESGSGGSGGIAWQASPGTTLYYEGAGTQYFAYYPYKEVLTGSPIPSATDAAGFFSGVVSAWTPATDQSTYVKYTAQDLMTGSGTPGGKLPDGTYSLSFTLKHAMALVVIETPTTKYAFTNNSPSIPVYHIPAPGTTFYGFTPYSPSIGTYRYLVKPAQSGADNLMGSYTAADGNTKEYTVAQKNLTAANYALYKVDKAAVTEKSHTLQAGDFYLSDGSLVGKDAMLSDAQKAACLGIVYWVGDIKGDNYGLLDSKFPGGTHGLVVSLWDMPAPDNPNRFGMTWTYGDGDYEHVDDWLESAAWSGPISRPPSFTSIQVTDGMQGYANTVALEEYNKYVENTDNHKSQDLLVKPVKGLPAFRSAHPVPASSSGWYWPSVYELKQVCWGQGVTDQGTSGKNMLNTQIGKVSSGDTFGDGNYWSSAEYSRYSRRAWYVYFGNGNVDGFGDKGYTYRVRPLLAF